LKRAPAAAIPSCSEKRAWQRLHSISTLSSSRIGLVEPNAVLQRAHRQLRVLLIDEAGDLISEVLITRMLTPSSAAPEHLRRHSRVVAHAHPEMLTLAIVPS